MRKILVVAALVLAGCGGEDEAPAYCAEELETLDGGPVCVAHGKDAACWHLQRDCGPQQVAVVSVFRQDDLNNPGQDLWTVGPSCWEPDHAAKCGETVRYTNDVP